MADRPPPNPQTIANLLTTHSSLVHTFGSFLTVVIHQVLSLRKIYPPVSFVSTRAYGYPVRQSRHPAVCEWVNDAVAMVRDQLGKNVLANVAMCIFECDENKVLERWVVDLRSFPIVDRKERDTPFARVEDEDTENAGGDIPLRRNVNLADLEAQFRAVLSRLSVSAAKLSALPSGDDAPELSFTITMEVRDGADRPTGRRRLPEQGWIAAEPEAFESSSDDEDTNIKDSHVSKAPEGKTVPIRRLEAGELRMEVWVEESKAKFVMESSTNTSSQQQSSDTQQFDIDKGYVLDPADINRPQPPSMASDYRR
jgi:mitotic spindle assembly checkpoint protein MAD2B